MPASTSREPKIFWELEVNVEFAPLPMLGLHWAVGSITFSREHHLHRLQWKCYYLELGTPKGLSMLFLLFKQKDQLQKI